MDLIWNTKTDEDLIDLGYKWGKPYQIVFLNCKNEKMVAIDRSSTNLKTEVARIVFVLRVVLFSIQNEIFKIA